MEIKTPKKEKESALKLNAVLEYSAKKPAEIACYYGFSPIGTVKVEQEDTLKVKELLNLEIDRQTRKHVEIYPEEKIALLRNYIERNGSRIKLEMLYEDGDTGAGRRHMSNEISFHLDIIGTTRSIAEATIIKTCLQILNEEGYENLLVEINTIGDKDSIARFTRELTVFFKKNISLLSPHCRAKMKTDPFDVLLCENRKCLKIKKEEGPDPISCLSENARKHFSEILEYFEELGVPYRINSKVVASKKICTGAVFEIKDSSSETVLARGIRYNGLSKKLGYKKDIGAVGIFACFKKTETGTRGRASKISPALIKTPKIYFIQLGVVAKQKSLEIIETLRKVKIPVLQSISDDKLAPQLEQAENMHATFVIIMGQKEAMENSIIVRNMLTRSQETIEISKLGEYLKKIKF
ncbi:MAG: hypothetical protein A3G52_00305 [Candidatus Taylorbacteria bacterium RIFCSPLOWO2_12_FULL_43_20]|uniref:Anticodon-binding domain-containing protein n=1 Tax=Candidatus Taylorbacteria bacterium RIFCSPLOWO2_12_FULL_43_20 TaxID=1802332 RepID=A0A1G2P1M6_9BACT|nr:MAG: hypothetical protein A2825_01700 [Candidatus Taylorbacteria bacterium RIFCSPHIGHO2_01_FULL_43_120]OHA23093.1 MAG: hypothetical protein A3B98_03505 [Candidatus Taylorbacteria bacterium RIFCSPHIGHO2_02_FULL_43_55]OHA28926.1 MAG: hypothetical protein A3E92_04625 [Candidatus Taylorbacteria bacterium RIFCSPHIGHO2_12_FULL_42_34]OHA30910.1 MAG: hypothetical protein A3B09_04575 [Candidatus Taylorbacteria bacterium RIFCSPLOWO2_01_FULL_43_83]OHA39296.1 MAG: hypothetical protein A3H58_03885 [Candi